MARFIKKIDKTAGLPPGSVVFSGKIRMDKPKLSLTCYDEQNICHSDCSDLESLPSLLNQEKMFWLNLDGVHDTGLVKEIGRIFDLPALVQEDLVNTGQRPKIDDLGNFVFITLKMLSISKENGMVDSEQLSIVLGKNFVITFQEQTGDVFDPVRSRLDGKRGRIRRSGPDYLVYALLDCVFENYVKIIEKYGEQVEDMQEPVLQDSGPALLETMARLKSELAFIGKRIKPARDVVMRLPLLDSDLINDSTVPYLKDMKELAVQSFEALEAYNELLQNHMNMYHVVMANRLSDIMRFLTIFSVIFIPLTFLAGIYGMNFKNLPGAEEQGSFYVLCGIMIIIVLLLLMFFKKKKWI